MNVKELIEFLSQFDPNTGVAVIALDTEKQLAYSMDGYQFIENDIPLLLFEIGESRPMSEIVNEKDSLS